MCKITKSLLVDLNGFLMSTSDTLILIDLAYYDVNKGTSVYYDNYESRPNNMLEIPKREQTLICEICVDLIN